ncbi:DUF983 domain-containing protein [Flaviaesturariibacter flavus]|uniref:DUF983 domain-containing protein n=1 Tax=Flaviaesturariibacter flavus TaxID=2502780 RepID=A0A4R1B5N0_9BACT|nr:DUF983 domain-containing protein [Flaviaesturariibacter flavus]TCJ13301.1 DUF983 domain-containing protein [Flaviaesturariibacter flavus]
MNDAKPHRGYLATIFGCYCPRCREGRLFRKSLTLRLRGTMEMYDQCPVCGQPTDIEVGFYYGTGYVSYFICIFITVATLLLWWLFIGFSFSDRRFAWWIGFNSLLLLVLQPFLMRFSRSLWLSWFVSYDPEWRKHPVEYHERINKDQMGNW